MEDKKGAGESGEASRKTHAIRRLPDGTICIGDGCSILRIPPTGDIEIDTRECPDEILDVLNKRLSEGAGADFKVRFPRKK